MVKALHTAIYRATTTRAVLIVFGAICGFYAYSTFHAYTVKELPLRNVCVILLIAIALLGLGAALIHPNAVMRSSVGWLVLAHSALRASMFAVRAWNRSEGLGDFLGRSNAMWVHLLVAYTGLLVWGRAHQDAVR